VRLFLPAAVVTNDELTDAFTILDRCMDGPPKPHPVGR
jgi:hypothetical protein